MAEEDQTVPDVYRLAPYKKVPDTAPRNLGDFLEICHLTHSLWCDCPEWRSHIQGWQGGSGLDGESTRQDGDGAEEDAEAALDAAIIAELDGGGLDGAEDGR